MLDENDCGSKDMVTTVCSTPGRVLKGQRSTAVQAGREMAALKGNVPRDSGLLIETRPLD